MSILLSFAPFIVLFVLLRLVSPLDGLGGALLVSLLLCLRVWRRREAVKILEIGSLVLFAVLTLYTLAATPAWTVAAVKLVVDAGLLTIVLVSVAIGRPFTLQYARERVPPRLWSTPSFIRANNVISLVWALAFAVLTAADAAAAWVPAIPLMIDIAASVIALFGAFRFTGWYPSRLRRLTPTDENFAA